MGLINDILYELQPVRFSDLNRWSCSFCDELKSLIKGIADGFIFLCYELRKIAVSPRQLMNVAALLAWCLAGYFSGVWRQAYVVISAIAAIFLFGLDSSEERRGDSAWSIFNRGYRVIAGTMTAEDMERQLRRRPI